ncbi:protein ABHD13 [Leptidea sinapis]|uniref:Serine aminopeptidase S33 domain-containing protein n=1 Tax=Leptidea sinapis TaxID=189913 RepID=A0A5E4QPB1_9NEOP|nr:protein ABHD13 [Leptidea sinapis]VVD00196.1 unnamed protein product [Leptidea sinapis]
MYNLLKIIIYRLWVFASLVIISSGLLLWFYGQLLAFTVFILGICGVLYTAQDLLLYYPNDPPDSRTFVLQPSNFQLPYENIKITTNDGYKIHLYLIKQLSNSNHIPTMIFFHGNAGNMGQRLTNVSKLYHKLNINILLVEYRGYGLSEGSPSETGLYTDAQAAFDYIMQRSDVDRSKILLFGRSLGGAIAIDLASRIENRNKIWAMIVENTFTSIPDMAKILLKWRILSWLPQFCHKNKYMSLMKMRSVLTPTLVISGSNDLLVPPIMGKELYVRCGAVYRNLAVMPGGDHDNTWTCIDYYSTIQQFLDHVPELPESVSPLYETNDNDSQLVHIV